MSKNLDNQQKHVLGKSLFITQICSHLTMLTVFNNLGRVLRLDVSRNLCLLCAVSAFLTGCLNMLAGTSEEENGIIAEQVPLSSSCVDVESSSSVVFPDIGGLPNDIESSSSFEILGSSSSKPPETSVVIGSGFSDEDLFITIKVVGVDGRFPDVDESVRAVTAIYPYHCKSLVEGENVCENAGTESGMVRLLDTNEVHFEMVFPTSWEFWQSQALEEGCNYYLMISKMDENVGLPVLTAVEGNRVEITQVKPMGVCNATQETLYVVFLIQFCGEISRTPQVDYKNVDSSNWNCGDDIEFYGEWRKL